MDSAKGNNSMYNSSVLLSVLYLSLLLLGTTAVGCQDEDRPGPEYRVLIDDLERTIQIPSAKPTIITLAPSVTEILFAAGGGSTLIAVTTADDYPPDVQNIPKITAVPLDHEAVVAHGPDLVIATDQINSVRDMEALATVGIPSFFLTFNTVSDITAAIRKAGIIAGTSEYANLAADSLEDMWRSRISALRDDAVKPKILLLAGYDVLYSFGRESYTNEMIEAAGGISVTGVLEGQSAVLSDEFVLSAQPDIIVGTFGDGFEADQLLEKHPTWSILEAAKAGRIYSISPDLVSRPGPRIFDGTQQLAEWVDQYLQTASE